MSAEWKKMLLGDFIELKRGYDLPKKQRSNGKIPLVSSAGISDLHCEAKATGPGVVTGRYGTIGEVYYIEEDYWPLNTTLYVCDFKGNDPRFVFYFLKTIDYLQFSDKAAVPGVNRNHLHLAAIAAPTSLDIQRRIASILATIDNKIELNRQINQTLEQMAQAIFKSWFVDFDPVHAKVQAIKEGRDPIEAAARVIGNPAIEQVGASLREIAELFPSEFVESELGLIPKRWGVKPVSDWGRVVCGKTPSKNMPKYYGADVPFIKIPDMHANMFATHTTDSLSDLGSKSQFNKQVPKGSVCVSCIATVGKVVIATQDSHTNQQINSIVPSKPYYTPYLYFTMKELSGHLHDLASGGSATLNLNTGNFSKIKTVFPTDSVLSSYSSVASRLMDKILNGYSSNSHWLNCATSCSPSSSPARSVSVMSNSMFGQYNDESVETVEIYR